nr:transposase [Luteimonas salinisoli]
MGRRVWRASPITQRGSGSWPSAWRPWGTAALGNERAVVEATGGYEEPLLEACCDAGLWIARVNPRQARDFARATGELAKTDAIDARLLALMARMLGDRPRRHVAPPLWQRELRDWLRRRGQVVVLIQAQKQQAAMARGRAPVRVALYMATLSAVRWDPLMKAHYQQLRARGKLGKVALVACMRKLLGIINGRRRDELLAEGLILA